MDTLEAGQAKIDSCANIFVLAKLYCWNKPVGTNVVQYNNSTFIRYTVYTTYSKSRT